MCFELLGLAEDKPQTAKSLNSHRTHSVIERVSKACKANNATLFTLCSAIAGSGKSKCLGPQGRTYGTYVGAYLPEP